ncbi:MFS transporter [Motilimonas cestriensis]|uniref:MFS transporter n=1 Tax=Motilimonas cestriensis TaxID=2742685 RepID=A0ABS8W729_9GAMM|nr:MFS transporter [Motilimonas cestriensis]MCE2593614.1 MFS transporter [Motilimonas cestriensis]
MLKHSCFEAKTISAITKSSWWQAISVYFEKRVAVLFLLGFSAGLPILLVFGTLSFWLREAGVDRALIGFASWAGLAYGFKWVWAPMVDRLSLPVLSSLLGRRRSWLLLSQLLIMAAIAGIAFTDPLEHLGLFVAFAVMVAFASATQDIVIDAYRIESAPEKYQAAMSASYLTGYRLAMIAAGAGALTLAALFADGAQGYHRGAWTQSYLVMMCLMLIGVITCLFCHEPDVDLRKSNAEQLEIQSNLIANGMLPVFARVIAWAQISIFMPFADFFLRYRWQALLILALVATYRISDIVMGIMANPFYVDMQFTKEQIAAVTKVFGVIMTLVGAGFGGILIHKFGTMKILFLGALLSSATNLTFAMLAMTKVDEVLYQGQLTLFSAEPWEFIVTNFHLLIAVISLDNLSGGIAISAFITYLSSLTNRTFSATQYALFSSVMTLLPKFIAGFSGQFVNKFGYVHFFIATAAIGIPVLILILLINRYVTLQQATTTPNQETTGSEVTSELK